MLDLITIENTVRELDEMLVELKSGGEDASVQNHNRGAVDVRMAIYHLEEARGQLVNLHFLVSTKQLKPGSSTEEAL